jgi:hypothetical protein
VVSRRVKENVPCEGRSPSPPRSSMPHSPGTRRDAGCRCKGITLEGLDGTPAIKQTHVQQRSAWNQLIAGLGDVPARSRKYRLVASTQGGPSAQATGVGGDRARGGHHRHGTAPCCSSASSAA